MVKPHDKPADVSHAGDEVLVDGPDGMTGSLTPEAALATAQRLEAEAVEAIVARHAENGPEVEDASDS